MAVIKPNLIHDSGAMMDKDCIKVVQSIWMSGLPNDSSVPYDALLGCGVILGQPYNLTNLYANQIEMRPVQSVTQAAIIVTYLRLWCNGGATSFVQEYGGGVEMDATNVDINNAPLRVKYNDQVTRAAPNAQYPDGQVTALIGADLPPKLTTVQAARPIGQLRIKFYQDIVDGIDDILQGYKDYQSYSNSTTWRNQPKWSWLCSGVNIEQVTIKQFELTMQFDWKPLWVGNSISTRRGNWVADCAYLLPESNGQPGGNFQKADPDGFPGVLTNGYLMGKVQGSTDFNALPF